MSLPYNLRGSIAVTDVSDPLTSAAESEAQRLDSDEEEVRRMWFGLWLCMVQVALPEEHCYGCVHFWFSRNSRVNKMS